MNVTREVVEMLRELATKIEASEHVTHVEAGIEFGSVEVPLTDGMKAFPNGLRTVRISIGYWPKVEL